MFTQLVNAQVQVQAARTSAKSDLMTMSLFVNLSLKLLHKEAQGCSAVERRGFDVRFAL